MTEQNNVSLLKAFAAALDTYKQNVRFFLMVSTVVFLIVLLGLTITGSAGYLWISQINVNFFTFFIAPVSLLVFIAREFYIYQLLNDSRRLQKGIRLTWHSFFSFPDSKFLYFLLARIRYIALLVLGLFLFVVPGVVYACTNFFAGYSIIHSLTDSLNKDATISRTLTKNNRLRIFLFIVIGMIIQSALGLLSIFTLPLELLISLEMYKQLMRGKEESIKAFTLLPPDAAKDIDIS